MTDQRAQSAIDALPVVAHSALGSLAVVLGTVELLLRTRRELTDAEIQEDLLRIARHADRAADLLESLTRDAADAAIDLDVRLANGDREHPWAQ